MVEYVEVKVVLDGATDTELARYADLLLRAAREAAVAGGRVKGDHIVVGRGSFEAFANDNTGAILGEIRLEKNTGTKLRSWTAYRG
jgi:hypothetical protein